MKNRKQKIYFAIKLFLISFVFFISSPFDNTTYAISFNQSLVRAQEEGFSCTQTNVVSSGRSTVTQYSCIKTEITRRAIAQSRGGVCVFKNTQKFKRDVSTTYVAPPRAPSPFIYLKNPLNGKIFISINSELNEYISKPSFNSKNGWVIDSKNGKIYVRDKEENFLDYEFAFRRITLNRHGKNFSSKEEVVNYLQNSNFFENLGFSVTEKDDLLNILVVSIKSAPERNFYYLNILNKKSIEQISQLNIKPRPDFLERVYFIVYPTNTSIKTVGNLSFPENFLVTDRYSIKEIGGFVVSPNNTFVSWED